MPDAKESTDPVGSSFLAIADILEALTKVQPGIAGPRTDEALAQIRTAWTPVAETPPVTHEAAPGAADHQGEHEQHQHQSHHKRHGHEGT